MAKARSQHLEFAPPATPGLLRSVALALLAHGLLLMVLTVGIQWKHDSVQETVEAELWSSIPVPAAAPAPLEEPPAPAEPAPETPPPPPPPPVPVVQPDLAAEAAIATARAKAERLKEEKAAQAKAELAKALKDKALKDKLAKEKLAKEKLAKEQAAQEKLAAEKAAKDKLSKQQADSKSQKEQKRKQELADAKAAKQLDDLRAQNLKRIAGMAGMGGNGAANSTSTSLKGSGPSAGYAGRIVARIKPNIVFTDDLRSNPRVEVEIRISPSGDILSTRITQSSGVQSWDDAVVRAIQKTEVLPKDIDGSIPTSMQIGFRPKD